MRILSFGDLHLDSSFVLYGLRDSSERRESLRQIFLDIVELARKSECDLMLITGDLFDTIAPTEETLKLVKSALTSLGIPVFISPGNHDYYIKNGIYDDMPANVFVFKEEALESVSIDGLSVTVDGYAFTSNEHASNPLSSYKRQTNRHTRLLCAHTDIFSASKYASFSPDILKSTEYAFAGLGHVHTDFEPKNSGNCVYSYSGVIQGRGPDEPVNGRINLVDIEDGKVVKLEQIDLSVWNNLVYETSVDGHTSDNQTVNQIISEITAFGGVEEKDTLRIELVGEHDCYHTPNLDFILSELSTKIGSTNITVKSRAVPNLDKNMLLNDPSVVGVLYRTLFENDKYTSTYSENVRKRAFGLALKALKGNDINPDNI